MIQTPGHSDSSAAPRSCSEFATHPAEGLPTDYPFRAVKTPSRGGSRHCSRLRRFPRRRSWCWPLGIISQLSRALKRTQPSAEVSLARRPAGAVQTGGAPVNHCSDFSSAISNSKSRIFSGSRCSVATSCKSSHMRLMRIAATRSPSRRDVSTAGVRMAVIWLSNRS